MKKRRQYKKRSKTERYNTKREKDEILLKYIKKLENEIECYKKKSSRTTKKKVVEKNPFKLILFLDMLKNKRKRQIENETVKVNKKFISKKFKIDKNKKKKKFKFLKRKILPKINLKKKLKRSEESRVGKESQ